MTYPAHYVAPTDPSRFPDLLTLERGLSMVLLSMPEDALSPDASERVLVLNRERSDFSSTYAAEEIRCRLPDGRELDLFCKYNYGHVETHPSPRRGLAFEAQVYDRVLRPLPLSQSRCYGALGTPHDHEQWLVLEYLADCLPASDVGEGDALSLAAAWAGRFHALNERRVDNLPLTFLPRYEADHYRFWSRRSWELCAAHRQTPDWLRTITELYEAQYVPLLATQPMTIIHGEFTPKNALWHAAQIKPIDWETAAIGVGEIDLAILLFDWDEEMSAACEAAYRLARWPAGPPDEHAEALRAARLYSAFHWIYGGDADIHAEDVTAHLEMLKGVCEREGLI